MAEQVRKCFEQSLTLKEFCWGREANFPYRLCSDIEPEYTKTSKLCHLCVRDQIEIKYESSKAGGSSLKVEVISCVRLDGRRRPRDSGQVCAS